MAPCLQISLVFIAFFVSFSQQTNLQNDDHRAEICAEAVYPTLSHSIPFDCIEAYYSFLDEYNPEEEIYENVKTAVDLVESELENITRSCSFGNLFDLKYSALSSFLSANAAINSDCQEALSTSRITFPAKHIHISTNFPLISYPNNETSMNFLTEHPELEHVTVDIHGDNTYGELFDTLSASCVFHVSLIVHDTKGLSQITDLLPFLSVSSLDVDLSRISIAEKSYLEEVIKFIVYGIEDMATLKRLYFRTPSNLALAWIKHPTLEILELDETLDELNQDNPFSIAYLPSLKRLGIKRDVKEKTEFKQLTHLKMHGVTKQQLEKIQKNKKNILSLELDGFKNPKVEHEFYETFLKENDLVKHIMVDYSRDKSYGYLNKDLELESISIRVSPSNAKNHGNGMRGDALINLVRNSPTLKDVILVLEAKNFVQEAALETVEMLTPVMNAIAQNPGIENVHMHLKLTMEDFQDPAVCIVLGSLLRPLTGRDGILVNEVPVNQIVQNLRQIQIEQFDQEEPFVVDHASIDGFSDLADFSVLFSS